MWFKDIVSDAIHGSNLNSSILTLTDDWITPWTEWLAYHDKLYKSYYGLDMWLFRRHKQIQNKLITDGVYSFKFTGEELKEDQIVCIFDDYEDRDEYLRNYWNDTSV